MSGLLTLYERNQLLKHGLGEIGLSQWGQLPVEYLIGLAQFYGYEFLVNPNVMIPRIETEEMVTKSIDFCCHLAKSKTRQIIRIADIGTGSGAIGLSLFLELEKRKIRSEIYLSDIAAPALEVVRLNLTRLVGPEKTLSQRLGRVVILPSDLLESHPPLKFDLILANLPYIPTRRLKKLAASVRDYEPHLALDGGDDGLVLIKKMLGQAPAMLKSEGMMILEIDETHQVNGFSRNKEFSVKVVPDIFGSNRFLVCRLQKKVT